MQHKCFWTWDHSTNWCHNTPGKQSVGANNEYTKRPETFLRDYQRVIDWTAANGITGITVAGLLRDCHGGVDYARKIATYAKQKNVRLLLCTGLLAYGGIYHDGDHPYSLERFLAENPQCLALRDGKPLLVHIPSACGSIYGTKKVAHACPSHPEVQTFVQDSLRWLFQAIPELGGVQMETGDTGICTCDACRKRRQFPVNDHAHLSFEDMAMYYPMCVEAVLSTKPDAQVICETYSHFNTDPNARQTFGDRILPWAIEKFQKTLPRGILMQWVCDYWLDGDKRWKPSDKMPLTNQKHIMRTHYGTYWPPNSRHKLSLEEIRKYCSLSAAAGFAGVSMFGEGSPFHPNTEFNYLALVYFADHPHATVADFAAEIMAPKLGGEEYAAQYIKMENNGIADPNSINESVNKISLFVATLPHDTARRWHWLASYLHSFQWEAEAKTRDKF
ncbi:MAG: hypothetical protein FWD61_15670 [Phycisphaerales bacterium]|nr:hypothetical protein [Phycisphaerales bacterium]